MTAEIKARKKERLGAFPVWILKYCPRDNGDMFLEAQGKRTATYTCLQCGNSIILPVKPNGSLKSFYDTSKN